MRRDKRLDRASLEAGFSLTEMLAAIAIVTAAMSALSWLLPPLVRAHTALGNHAALLQTDHLIRRHIAAIAIPYWEQQARITQTESSVEIPWYEGAADHSLGLSHDEYGVLISISGPGDTSPIPIKGFRIDALDILRGEDGRPRGLDIRYRFRGIAARLTASFNSAPLQRTRL
ncbi:MAG: prepilin-type N-terminal cleavage/methylation domain-containing protein [Treponema sp.]|jgi:prepilin-type N-terminal cleavage/methylation domain-containing protein|nr:prepilin-type N-terminal cleavage/methylation domain-containing protein [Treponema sp.]